MITSNIPNNAKKITYSASNTKKGEFFVWPAGKKWHWQALGNCGEEDSEVAAGQAAREWIANGIHSRIGFRK